MAAKMVTTQKLSATQVAQIAELLRAHNEAAAKEQAQKEYAASWFAIAPETGDKEVAVKMFGFEVRVSA